MDRVIADPAGSDEPVPLFDAMAMRAVDAWAIGECGVPGLELMEAAGEGLARLAGELTTGIQGPAEIAVVCGAGNNGGDGYVAARLLREQGHAVSVLTTVDPDGLAGDALTNRRRLPGDAPRPFDEAALAGAGVIVDAILGTGASGAPREDVAAVIEAINGARRRVAAADLPSGVDAGTGETPGAAIRAHVTATFAGPKTGLFIAPGKQHAGEVTVIPLPVPPHAPAIPSAYLLGRRGWCGALPPRGAGATKFTSGQVVVAGGSRGLSGAPCMASLAAIRAGAGYVLAAVPSALIDVVEGRLLEVMTAVLPGPPDHHAPENAELVLERLDAHGGALVLGPGLGGSREAQALARELAVAAPVPLVLDADGLNAHAGRLEALAEREHETILTPHPGELARLLETDAESVQRQRLAHAREAARRAHAIVVLKGDDTIVVDPDEDGPPAISNGGCPALATAGTGDVLAGVIGALAARRDRGVTARTAATLGVGLHAEAGRVAAARFGGPGGVIATDVIAALPGLLGDDHERRRQARAVAAPFERGRH